MNKKYRTISESQKKVYDFVIYNKSDMSMFAWMLRSCTILMILYPVYFKGNTYVDNILFVYELFCWCALVLWFAGYTWIIIVPKNEEEREERINVVKSVLKKPSIIGKIFMVLDYFAIIAVTMIGNISLVIVMSLIKFLYYLFLIKAKEIVKEENVS